MRAASYEQHERPTPDIQDGSDNSLRADLHDAILRWYAHRQRDLPWRRTRDPYRIMVSEIMLQQTQVDRVIPKYEEFLTRFPTIADLAAASLSDVLRVWSPLGYNRRARYLHLAARAASERFQGDMPTTLLELRTLPGLGRYTAGAVACFAFEQQVPIVDTNVKRVLGRAIAGVRDGVSDSTAWKLAEAALPEGHAYTWNQALMDLGATVCGAENPRCDDCPIQSICSWRTLATATGTPTRRVREASAEYGPRPDAGAPRRRWRGRIVNALRTYDHSGYVPWPDVIERLPAGHESDDVNLEDLLRSLAADGLVELQESDTAISVRLPQ